jgi:hypothetical protein
VALRLLASTWFTVLTSFRDGHFQWEYFRYFSQSGWGVPYQFSYSLPIVLVYLFAYSTGLVTYYLACRSGTQIAGLAGMLLCAAGLASFIYELSHWFVDHYGSWISSAPIALLVLAPVTAIQQFRQNKSAKPWNQSIVRGNRLEK